MRSSTPLLAKRRQSPERVPETAAKERASQSFVWQVEEEVRDEMEVDEVGKRGLLVLRGEAGGVERGSWMGCWRERVYSTTWLWKSRKRNDARRNDQLRVFSSNQTWRKEEGLPTVTSTTTITAASTLRNTTQWVRPNKRTRSSRL